MPIDTLVDRALAIRASLLDGRDTDAVRVFNGQCDGLAGLVVEKLAGVCVVQMHEDRLTWPEDRVRLLAEEFHRRLGTRAVYRKVFVRDRGHVPPDVAALHKDSQPWIGQPVEPELAVREHGLRFLIHPYAGFSVGLFLEHRDNRRRVRELAAGRRVLNAFSYTGGFSVAAAAGGATLVASVDLSKRYLEWSKRNFAANSLDLGPHRFYCSDILAFYRRAHRQGHRYDLIVLDPPTFSRQPHTKPEKRGRESFAGTARRVLRTKDSRPLFLHGNRVFELAKQLDALVGGALGLLDPGGTILLATNDRGLDRERLEGALRQADASRRCTIVDHPPLPVDFAGDPNYFKTLIARFD